MREGVGTMLMIMCVQGTRGQDDQYMHHSEIADYAGDLRNACVGSGDQDFNGQRFRTVSSLISISIVLFC